MVAALNGHYKIGLIACTEENADLFRPALRQMQEVLIGTREAPKPGRKKDGGQPKAKTENKKAEGGKTPAEEKQPATPKAAEIFPEIGNTVELTQERTKKAPLPDTFFFEAVPDKVTKPRGHQVDPSRVEACSPVMPNVTLLVDTGNPYPAAADVRAPILRFLPEHNALYDAACHALAVQRGYATLGAWSTAFRNNVRALEAFLAA
jgi:hypothetical protein